MLVQSVSENLPTNNLNKMLNDLKKTESYEEQIKKHDKLSDLDKLTLSHDKIEEESGLPEHRIEDLTNAILRQKKRIINKHL